MNFDEWNQVLKEMETFRKRCEDNHETNVDWAIRVCEAIIAEKAGYSNRASWNHLQQENQSTKIIVELHGGLVQEVYCNDRLANAEVLDRDLEGLTAEELAEEMPRIYRLEREAALLHKVL